MCFINNQSADVRQDGAVTAATMDGVCQQQIVVTDLKQIAVRVAGFHIAEVPAAIPAAITNRGDTHTISVILTEMGGLVCVQMIPQGEECLGGQRIFSFQVYLPQAAHQTLITDIVAFSFSNDRPDGGLDQLILQKNRGEERDVFLPYRRLQGDAGGGNEDGLERDVLPAQRTRKRNTSHQIGIGLADSRSRVT